MLPICSFFKYFVFSVVWSSSVTFSKFPCLVLSHETINHVLFLQSKSCPFSRLHNKKNIWKRYPVEFFALKKYFSRFLLTWSILCHICKLRMWPNKKKHMHKFVTECFIWQYFLEVVHLGYDIQTNNYMVYSL